MAKGRNIRGITIEIGGDTTKLSKALSGTNKEIANTKSSLKDVERLLKLDPSNTELLTQKQRMLTDAVSGTEKKLTTLKTAAQQAKKQLEMGKITQGEFDDLQREIIATEKELKKLSKEASNANTTLSKIGTAGGKLKTAGKKASDVGKKMLPATAAVAGMGTAAIKTTADFDSAMSQVQATMGITSDSMSTVDGKSVKTTDALRSLAKQMGSETAFSASECAEGLNYLALAGYDTQQMCDTLPTVLNLAAAGNIDLASASDMVTDAMSALGMKTSDADTMVDQMSKTASTTNTSVAQLGEGILTIGATAKTIKGGTAELNAALGILANNGIKGAEGGTHLRNVILSLQNPTDKAAMCLEELGVNVYDSQGNMRSLNDVLGDLNGAMDGMTSKEKSDIISRIFNKTDIASVNSLLDNTGGTWDKLQKNIADSGGAAQQMADTQLDNLSGQITILKSAVEGLLISVGEALMPTIREIVGHVQSLVDWLNSLDEKQRNTIIKIAAIVAAVGPVLIFIGKIGTGIGTLLTIIPKLFSALNVVRAGFTALKVVMAANPIGLVVVAIGLLVAAFMHLWNTSESFRNFWIGLWDKIKTTAVNIGKSVAKAAGNMLTSVKTKVTGVYSAVKNGIGKAVSYIKNLPSKALTWGKDFIGGFIDGIKNKASELTGKIGDLAGEIASFLHFSRPDEGPLHYYEQWMPDFMRGLAAGIERNRGLVTNAISGLASDMTLSPSVQMATAGNASTAELRALRSDVRQLRGTLASMQVVMDTGATVGALAPGMDNALGRISSRRGRGN